MQFTKRMQKAALLLAGIGLVLSLLSTNAVAEKKQKALVIRANKPVAEVHAVTSTVVPVGPVAGFQTSGDKTVVFVSQDRDIYRLGENVTVAYGATRAGWLSLFVQYPNGKTEFLKKQHVDGKSIYTLKAKAVRPTGHQNLMALFSAEEKAQFPMGNIRFYTNYFFNGKGLELLPSSQHRPVYNISRFTIE